MIYVVYVNGKKANTIRSIEDLMYYINMNDLSIIEETEDLENFVVTLDCEYK